MDAPGVFEAFQSPSGVLGVCRTIKIIRRHRPVLVSVPFRGFRGLQGLLISRQLNSFPLRVSVPFRGFRGLKDPHPCD